MQVIILKIKNILRQAELKFNRHAFEFKFWPSLIALLMLIILLLLGAWQMKRYHYKQHLMSQYQQAIQQNPIAFSQLNLQHDIHFQHVHVSGIYLNDRSLLLENRFYHDKLGFEVLTPFQVEHGKVLLINRGWVPMIADQQAANIKPVIGEQRINGYIQVLGYQGFTLGKDILTSGQWPLLIQKINIAQLQQLTHLNFYPFVLRLDSNQTSGFVSEWKPTTVLPQRHLGYAIQWFTMAFALLIAFMCFAYKKNK
jgi:surfeit locus 1 family protein